MTQDDGALDKYCRLCGQALLPAHQGLGVCVACIATAAPPVASFPVPGYRFQRQEPEAAATEPPWPG